LVLFLRSLLRDSTITFLLFSIVVCISSIVFLTLAFCFYGFSFW
jgi:hypothetical protein